MRAWRRRSATLGTNNASAGNATSNALSSNIGERGHEQRELTTSAITGNALSGTGGQCDFPADPGELDLEQRERDCGDDRRRR
jgi:hypothetical protein